MCLRPSRKWGKRSYEMNSKFICCISKFIYGSKGQIGQRINNGSNNYCDLGNLDNYVGE